MQCISYTYSVIIVDNQIRGLLSRFCRFLYFFCIFCRKKSPRTQIFQVLLTLREEMNAMRQKGGNELSVVRKFETGKIARDRSIWPIGCFTLGGGFQVVQATQGDGLFLMASRLFRMDWPRPQ